MNCSYCETELTRLYFYECRPDNAYTTDHFIPRSRGGANCLFNMIPCCNKCNNLKGSLLPTEFIQQIKQKIIAVENPEVIIRNVARLIHEKVGSSRNKLLKIGYKNNKIQNKVPLKQKRKRGMNDGEHSPALTNFQQQEKQKIQQALKNIVGK